MTNNTTPTTEQAWGETQKQINKLFTYLFSDDTRPIPDRAEEWAEHVTSTSSLGEVRDIWARIGVAKLFLADLGKNIRLQAPEAFPIPATLTGQNTAAEEAQK